MSLATMFACLGLFVLLSLVLYFGISVWPIRMLVHRPPPRAAGAVPGGPVRRLGHWLYGFLFGVRYNAPGGDDPDVTLFKGFSTVSVVAVAAVVSLTFMVGVWVITDWMFKRGMEQQIMLTPEILAQEGYDIHSGRGAFEKSLLDYCRNIAPGDKQVTDKVAVSLATRAPFRLADMDDKRLNDERARTATRLFIRDEQGLNTEYDVLDKGPLPAIHALANLLWNMENAGSGKKVDAAAKEGGKAANIDIGSAEAEDKKATEWKAALRGYLLACLREPPPIDWQWRWPPAVHLTDSSARPYEAFVTQLIFQPDFKGLQTLLKSVDAPEPVLAQGIYQQLEKRAQQYYRVRLMLVGWVQYLTLVAYFAALVMLRDRYNILRRNQNTNSQRSFYAVVVKRLHDHIVPALQQGNQAITWQSVITSALAEIKQIADRNVRRLAEVEYSPIDYFIYAMPSLGFIGTVVGIGGALGNANSVVLAVGAVEQAKRISGITDILGTAFDTTLVALIASIIIMAMRAWLGAREVRVVTDAERDLSDKVLSRDMLDREYRRLFPFAQPQPPVAG